MADSIEKQMGDRIKIALTRRNHWDDEMTRLSRELHEATGEKAKAENEAIRLRMAKWTLEGELPAKVTEEKAAAANDVEARDLKRVNQR